MTNESNTMKGTRTRFWLLTICFILVAFAWVVHAILVASDVSSIPFWKVAEVSSIIITLFVSVAFWVVYIRGYGEHTAILKGTDDPLDTLKWVLWLGLFAVGFIVAALVAAFAPVDWLGKYDIIVQVLFLAVGAGAAVQLGRNALRTTYVSLRKCKVELDRTTGDEQENKASEVLDKFSARDNISKFLCFSDIPIAFAMIVVFLLVVLWTIIRYTKMEMPHTKMEMRAFIAGAVALQLLYSNCVYWIEAWADTPKGRNRLYGLSPAFQTVRRMLLPGERPDGMTIIEWAESKLNELFPPDGNGATLEAEPLASMPPSQQTETDEGLGSTTTDGEK